MITVTADVALAEKLRQANGPAEIRDPEGKVVGFFAPVSVNHALQYAQVAARIDRAELARRKASEKTGRTTREVFERLKTLTQDPETLAHLQQKIDGLEE
jgi:hypothetical protein